MHYSGPKGTFLFSLTHVAVSVAASMAPASIANAAPTSPVDIPASLAAKGPPMDSKKEAPSWVQKVSTKGSHNEGVCGEEI